MNPIFPHWVPAADGGGPWSDSDPVPSREFRATALLDVRGLTVAAGPDPADPVLAEGITLSISRGEAVGLLDAAGSGAAAIGLAVAGRLPPPALIRSGSILLDGQEVVGASARTLARLRSVTIGCTLSADGGLDPERAIGRQLAAAVRTAQRGTARPSRSAVAQRALDLLDLVGIADPQRTAAQHPNDLGTESTHRVRIARALAGDPALLILDDPTAGVDPAAGQGILDLVRRLRRERRLAVVLVSDRFEVVAASCHRVAVLHAGTIVEQGSVAEVRTAARHPETRRLRDAERPTPHEDDPEAGR